MAKVKYSIQSDSKSAQIYLRLSVKREVAPKKKTGLFINSKDWSKATGLPKQNSPDNKNLHTELKDLDNHIVKKCNEATKNGLEINGKWLKNEIDLFFERISPVEKSELLIDYIQYIIDTADTRKNARGKLGLSDNRIKAYKYLKGVVEKFQQFKNVKYKVKEVTPGFAKIFLQFLIKNEKYSQSTAAKLITDLKTTCNDADLEGLEISTSLNKIKNTSQNSNFIIFLSPEELKMIKNVDLESDYLLNARKWLLFGCSIGQRVGDLLDISLNNFVNKGGLEIIELTQQKTGKTISIPVLDETKEVLRDGFPRRISAQRLNEYIKIVCEKSGISEPTEGVILKKIDGKKYRKVVGTYPKHKLITSHVCRRSYATNNYGILPTPLIMQITAHSTEKMFLKYIGKNSLDYAQQITDFFTSLKQKKKQAGEM